MTCLRRRDMRLALILSFAVILASIFGPGIMPARMADGTFTIILCTDRGLVEVDAAAPDPAHPAEHAAKGGPCAWAAAHPGPTLAAAPPDVPPVPAPASRTVPLRPALRVADAAHALAFAARAPPDERPTAVPTTGA